MNVRDHETGLEVIDQSRRCVRPELGADWQRLGNPRIPSPDITNYDTNHWSRIKASFVRVPPVGVTVIDVETGDRRSLMYDDKRRLGVSGGEVVVFRTGVILLVRPEQDCTLTRTPDAVTLSSSEDSLTATVGYYSRRSTGVRRVSVNRSPDGIAQGLSALGCAISPSSPGSPDRTWPAVRRVPPRLSFDGEGRDPDDVEYPNLDVEIIVPAQETLRWLYPTAGLLHYIGAEATVDSSSDVARLRAGSRDWTIGETPEEADQTASRWLRRVFGLDCHARAASQHGVEKDGHGVLDVIGYDAGNLYEMPLADRLAVYLNLTDEKATTVDSSLPEWHLGIHIAPEIDRAPSLAYHLRRLPDVVLPDAAELSTLGEQAQWSAKERVRGPENPNETEDQLVVVPDDSRARTIGWDAPDQPVGAFDAGVSTDPPAPRRLDDRPIEIVVVRCSPLYPATEVIDRYRAREEELALEVTTVGNPTVSELAGAFERETDLIHVIAHSDENGIECRNGFLGPESIDSSGADAFMLNSCSSYSFGEKLLSKGAVAGAVTTGTIPDETAAELGPDWAGLISLGWSIERALDFARSTVDPSAYVALGDGTHVVTQSDSPTPPLVDVHEDGRITIDHIAPLGAGVWLQDALSETYHLPSERTYELSEPEQQRLSDVLNSPVRKDGALHWDWKSG